MLLREETRPWKLSQTTDSEACVQVWRSIQQQRTVKLPSG